MNNTEFRQHFVNICEHLNIVDYESRTYIVCPVEEEGKPLTSTDDMMRLCFLPKTRKADFEKMLKIFTWKEGIYPLWIKVTEEDGFIVLRTSLRMRKAGVNDDKKYYPFRVER